MQYGTGKYRYELVDGWAKIPQGYHLVDVAGIGIDAQDRVFVLNRGTSPVIVFDRDGNMLRSFGEGHFKRAHGACITPDGSIYCTDDGAHIVTKFNAEGKILSVLGKRDQPSDTGYIDGSDLHTRLSTIKRGGPPFNRPTGVALSPTGELYVSDGYGNARVHRFAPDSTLILSWGEPGYGPGQFRLPHSVWVDKKERVWVVDRENNRIQIFNNHGEILHQWIHLHRPSGIYIDQKDTVYISELRQRVSIFNIGGTLLARWESEGDDYDNEVFVAPHSIAVDSHGDIYIGEACMSMYKCDRGARTIQKFARVS
jgi:DNA-binding beta-propeller fold protein YncE